MNSLRSPVFFRFLLLALSLALAIGAVSFYSTRASSAEDRLPIESTRKFVDIIEKIKQSYVEEVTDEELFDYAIHGMLSGLDPHSSYLSMSENAELQIRTRGEFGGLGIHITLSEEGFVRVVSPIDDTPAARAGVQPEDLIISLDGKPIQNKPLDDILDLMRGKPGTKISITIVRKGESKPFDITLERAVIHIRSVVGTLLEDGYGYIRVSSFQANTANDLVEAYQKLVEESSGDLKGLVFDLRNNPGGLLPAAIAVSDFFLPAEKLVVYTKGRTAGSNQQFYTKQPDISQEVPLVVLINNGSASASEIVAGAMQDHKRAVILGINTFGKGSVQTILPLSESNAIKLTTALFFSPSGRSIQAEGISPDIEVQAGKVSKTESNKQNFSEADLSEHLKNSSPKEKQRQEEKQEAPELADSQVYEAYKLLKAVNIYALNLNKQR